MKQRINAYQDAGDAFKKLIGLNETLTATFDLTLRHLIDIRVSRMNDCHFCINMHTKEAKDGGESDERIEAVNHWQASPLFTAREKAAFAWAEVLTRAGSQDEIVALLGELGAHFNKEEIANLTMVIAHINAWNRIGIASYEH
ncbi:MAG: carboxymuconolactone decarboxylase family protein [Parvibaculaceae bacterium]